MRAARTSYDEVCFPYPPTTLSRTNSGNNTRVLIDGGLVFCAYGQYVECWDRSGSQQWVFDHGAAVNDIATDGQQVYLVGNTSGSREARALNRTTGTLVWSYQHNATLYAVACNGKQVFVAGNVSGSASSATHRALNASNGYDATNEGGTGADTDYVAWNQAASSSQACSKGGQLATDGRLLYCGYAASETNQVEIRDAVDGVPVSARGLPSASVKWVAVDDELLYLATDESLQALSKRNLAASWQYVHDVSGTRYETNAVATDGCGVYVAQDDEGGDTLVRVYRGNRPRIFRRVDPADQYLSMRTLLIPSP